MPAPSILARRGFLVIEDFGTTGLRGAWDRKDDQGFSDFWRRIGRSHKRGQQGGRWGLGKLVFSGASRVRSFFGLTIQAIRPGAAPAAHGPSGAQDSQRTAHGHDLDAARVFLPASFSRGPFPAPRNRPHILIRNFARAAGITRVT